jgi:hypothetical protein
MAVQTVISQNFIFSMTIQKNYYELSIKKYFQP